MVYIYISTFTISLSQMQVNIQSSHGSYGLNTRHNWIHLSAVTFVPPTNGKSQVFWHVDASKLKGSLVSRSNKGFFWFESVMSHACFSEFLPLRTQPKLGIFHPPTKMQDKVVTVFRMKPVLHMKTKRLASQGRKLWFSGRLSSEACKSSLVP